MANVLVLCTGNSCRSQMAEGWLRHFGGASLSVYSAGIETHGVNPRAIRVMGEAGVDITRHTSDNVDQYTRKSFDFIITVCDSAKENCPYFPGEAVRIHHSFTDPAGASGSEDEILDVFRIVRDEVRDWSEAFVKEHLQNRAHT